MKLITYALGAIVVLAALVLLVMAVIDGIKHPLN